ncbi:MAG: diguanylate cyclase/phosphodiesterase & domain with sensor [Pseudonocardiales bacterium]|nr:diguanylate cyclase/phosphodiesterase & domain with sensor [Pseudonocardiales bacterium]
MTATGAGPRMDDRSAGFLAELGRRLRASIVQFVPVDRRAPALWFDRDIPGDEAEAELLERFARDWYALRPLREASRIDVVDGWQAAVAAVAGPAYEDGGALLVARGPGPGWSTADRAMLEFAAHLYPLSTQTQPSMSADDWTRYRQAAVTQDGGALGELYDLAAHHEPGSLLALYAISVDGIAVVNEVLGHDDADKLLQTISRRLRSWVGAAGKVSRVAGPRFVALRPDLDDESRVLSEATRLSGLLAEPVRVGAARISRSASIGVAFGRQPADPPGGLVTHAVSALRRARAAGGNTIRVHDAAAHAELVSRFKLELQLHNAVSDGGLRLFYQPEFDLPTGRIRAVEALLRWQHPDLGLLEPDAFIVIAEESHAIGSIGDWVIDEAVAQLARWQHLYPHLRLGLSVNVAAVQFAGDGIAATVRSALERHDVPGDRLRIEITERSMPQDQSDIVRTLAELHDAGVSSAIDDFGTGQVTLAHLLALPVDAIKIDRRFVSGMLEDARSSAVVVALVELARALGLDVIAEGVETQETADELVRMGCTRGQGILFAPPLSAEALVPMLIAGERPTG